MAVRSGDHDEPIEVAVIGRFADDSHTAEDGTRRVRMVLEAEVVAQSLGWAIAR